LLYKIFHNTPVKQAPGLNARRLPVIDLFQEPFVRVPIGMVIAVLDFECNILGT
jgi:uncharacterized membrane protein